MSNYNMAFYTYFIGSNNNSAYKIPPLPSEIYKCYYYTNNKSLYDKIINTGWIPVYIDIETTDDIYESNMLGKIYKTKPHELKELSNYDYTCFIDSKLGKINIEVIENLIKNNFIDKDYCLILRKHWFVGNSVYDELNECMNQNRYILEKEKYIRYINKQVENGLLERTIDHCACGFLIRNMKHRKIIEFNETWYNHIKECGIQDQISFFFVKQLFNDYYYSFSEIPFI